jgi:hypothetical protein
LTELVAIGHMRECPENQIRTHYSISLKQIGSSRNPRVTGGAAGASKQRGPPPNFNFQGLDAQIEQPVQNSDALSQIWSRPHAVSVIQIAALGAIHPAFPFQSR